MKYSDEVVEEVRSRNDIVDVISGYIKLQRKGSYYMGLCPFHNEKTPSFSVTPSRQMYHCFGCGVSGDVFSFVMEYDHKNFQEAVETLAERCGYELPKPREDQEVRREHSLRKRLLEIQKEAATRYYKTLFSPQGGQALAYLQKRGLRTETIRSFGLGYAGRRTGSLYAELRESGYNDAELKASGLFQYDGAKKEPLEKFWNRVIFPIMDLNKKVIGFGGRVMGDAKPKYLNSPETPVFDKSKNLYGLYAARRVGKERMLLCEGYMDVISLHMFGFTNAVATLGTALTSDQAVLFRRFTKEVLILYDSDAAGTKASLRAIPILRSAGLSSRVVSLDPYKDPDELLQKEGAAFLQKRLDEAENGFLFEIRMLTRSYDMKDPKGVSDFQHAVARKLMTFPDEIERESYLKSTAAKYNLDTDLLRRYMGSLAMSGAFDAGEEVVGAPHNGLSPAEKQAPGEAAEDAILSWISKAPELAREVKKYMAPEDFSGSVRVKIAEALLEGDGRTVLGILNLFEESEERNAAARILENSALPEKEEEQLRALQEAIVRAGSVRIETALAGMTFTDMAQVQKIMEQKKKLDLLKNRLSGGK